MYRILLYAVAALAILTGLIVGAQNAAITELDLLFWTISWPLGLLIVLAFVFGLLIGLLAVYVLRVIPLKITLRRQAKANPQPPV